VPICVVIFKENQSAEDLIENLKNESTPLTQCQLVKPSKEKQELNTPQIPINDSTSQKILPVEIDKVKLFNPKLARQIRQNTMAFWLMPFGFITGLAFTQMTSLETFKSLGVGSVGEYLIGGLLGMGSGLIGSYVASASVNPDENDDIGSLRKLNKDGLWLLLIETPLEIELPWKILKESNHDQIMKLNNI